MRFRPILEAGIRAPSGDNCQPWRFQAAENRIDLFNIPECDTSLYNYKQRASLVAHGACIENMLIAARASGFSATVEYFPTPDNELHVARLNLTECEAAIEPLFASISIRGINRKPYRKIQLSPELADSLSQAAAASGVEGCSFVLLQGDRKNTAAEIVALSDRLVFENRHLHGFLFDHIRWTREEAERTRDGLDIRTLELSPQDRMLFPLLKNFGFVRAIGKLGATRIIAANAKTLMQSASAAGLITIADTSPENWLNAGRMLERVWLEAVRQGAALHLMTGITLMVQRARDGVAEALESGNVLLVKQADTLLSRLAGAGATVALLFRIGYAEAASTKSLRMELKL